MRALPLWPFLAVLLPSGWASAHLGLVDPPSRYGTGTLKTGPCGQPGGTRSANVTTYASGSVITLTFDEYIDHPGHFRISFDDDGDDSFVDPLCLAGCNTTQPTIERYSNDTVLLDGIADTAGGLTVIDIPLPDVECTNCTLQVIQVMYDKPPYTLPGNDIYYQCADLILVRNPPPDAGVGNDVGVPPVDAGFPDAGFPGDVGPPGDTGAPGDTGGPLDLGFPGDAGPPEDGGLLPGDAGLPPGDAGFPGDARPTDASPAGPDAGRTNAKLTGGCRCAGAEPAAPIGLLGALLGWPIFLWSRRRH